MAYRACEALIEALIAAYAALSEAFEAWWATVPPRVQTVLMIAFMVGCVAAVGYFDEGGNY